MLYDSNYVLNMDNNELLKKIRESKFIGYRLGDVVLNYPCARETYIKGCYLINKKKFPNSIAIKYTTLYKDKKCLGKKIGNQESLDDSLSILMELCDEISCIKPNNTSLVASIRLGDMIEDNKEKRNGKELVKYGGTYYSPKGGSRHILSANEIIEEAKEKNLNEVILVGSKAIGCGNKSIEYLKNMICIIEQNNLKCRWFYSFYPDEDLAFISKSKNIITGPGGFCLVAEAISNFRFNKKINIKPIKGGISFK